MDTDLSANAREALHAVRWPLVVATLDDGRARPQLLELCRTQAAADAALARCARTPGARVLPYGEFSDAERRHWLGGPLTEVPAAEFHEMLEVLPPVHWESRDGVERFLMMEHDHAGYTRQYAKRAGRHFRRVVCAHTRATWIAAAEIDRHLAGDPPAPPHTGW